ncbi:MAG: lipopolysaccharide biosynthesis protein [Bacteroidota bacterium]
MLWSSVHRFGTMAITFITNLVLARLLTPEDFGIIGMIMVFIALSETFVDGGFASALIQKKRPTEKDYSTIFYWNLFVSMVLFLLLYLLAPSIERFYEMESLAEILQVLGIILIINAFNIIQFNKLNKQINFKKVANIFIAAGTLGGAIGISLAYMGFGVWSLVAKMLADRFFQSIFLWSTSSWRPSFIFSKKSIKELFGYGSYMLMTNLLIRGYDNLLALIIGKLFSADQLGYYVQAEKMRSIPVKGLSAVVNQVTFPVYAELQDDIDRLVQGLRKSLKAITYVNFPLMVILIIIAKPLILFLFTEKWAQSILYFQILAAGGMVYSLNTVNNNVFKSLGESRLYFIVLLFKRITGITMILVGSIYGLVGMLVGVVINNYLSFFIGMYYSSKLSGYKVLNQLGDVYRSYLLSIFVGLIVYVLMSFIGLGFLYDILIGTSLYVFVYFIISHVFKLESYMIHYNIVKSKFLTVKN